MIKFAICNETYQAWTLANACQDAAACGYQGIEIAPFTLAQDPSLITEKQAQEAGSTAKAAGLDVVGLHWLLVKPSGFHLTSPDAAVRKRTGEFAIHLARICAAMGGRVMVWGSPVQRRLADGQSQPDGLRLAAEVLRKVCETAGPLGVSLAMEPLGPAETNFLNTAQETIRLIEMVAHPACRLQLDVKAMSSESMPIPQIIRASRTHLAHFHANDPNRRGPGAGEMDFRPIAATLHEIGYDGYVSVEVFDYWTDPHSIAASSLEYLRRTFS